MKSIRMREFALGLGVSALGSVTLLATPAARADDGTFAVVYAFPAGAAPHGAVVIDAAGTVYGTTSAGGKHGFGTLYAWSDAGGYVVLHDFRGAPDDGAAPLGSLAMDKKGVLWGTTSAGGASNAGTVFRLSAKGAFAVVASLDGNAQGGDVIAGVSLGKDGLVYGAASTGGANGRGTVFRVDPTTSLLSVIHTFDDSDADGGKQPEATPTIHDGMVLGTTYYGRIYRMAPDGSAYETLFPGETGNLVFTAGVTADHGGNLWGAAYGGDQGVGQIWEITAKGTFKWRQGFSADTAQDGLNPTGTLAAAPQHTFYGVTARGGDPTCSCGAVFSTTKAPGGLQVVHALLAGTDGADPEAGLVADAQGRFYGVTMRAGPSGGGTLFRITPAAE